MPALPPISLTSPSRQLSLSHHSSYKPKTKEAPHNFASDGTHVVIEYDKLQDLESRIGSLEQANKALLEELMLVHGDLKKKCFSQDDLAQEVYYLKSKLEAKNSFLESQLGQRVTQNETDVESNKEATDSLLHSTHKMEQELQKVETRMRDMTTELTRYKDALHQMESERAKQDVWLKER